jgi:transposase
MSQSAVSRIWRAFGLKPAWCRPGSYRRTRSSSRRSATWWTCDRPVLPAPPTPGVPAVLKLIDAGVPDGLELHLICDNYATHKTPEVKRWLLRHPRFHLHFTPASSSWMNLVERWFAELTNRELRRSAHRSVAELEAGIRRWISEWNRGPKPFMWTKTADEILDTLAAYCQRINDLGHQVMA